MARRRVVRFSLIGFAGLVAALLVAVLVLAVILVRRPFPAYSGTRTVAGLSGPVSVQRDDKGIPQLYADTAQDLFRAQGYVQAQDRFFEMDWRRHVTAGRLSELVGPDADALAADKVVRTLGWRRVAQQEYAELDATTRGYLQAYAAGVNAYLAGRNSSQLSVNYTLLGLSVPQARVERWTPVDSLAWFKAMAWDLRGNYTDELDRARIYGSVRDVDRIAQLYPLYPYQRHAPILQDVQPPQAASQGQAPSGAPSQAHAGVPRCPGPAVRAVRRPGAVGAGRCPQRRVGDPDPARRRGRGRVELVGGLGRADRPRASRCWPTTRTSRRASRASGTRWGCTAGSCRSACPFDVSGYTFSGVPGVVIGHNSRIAWGLTNLGPDVTDFYLEQVRGDTYLQDGTWRPLTTRAPRRSRWRRSADVRITVRATLHGPLLSDVLR